MAFGTYAELQAAILSRMDRSDLTTEVVDWITIAENDINRWLRTEWTEKRAYTAPDGAFVELPLDFNSLRNIQWDYQNYRIPLKQVSPDLIDKMVPSTTAGIPEFYCVHSGQFELRPAPSADNTTEVEIVYNFKPAALSDSNTSNETLENAPELLFYRAVAEGFSHLFEEEKSMKYLGLYEGVKRSIKDDDKKRKWGEGPLRVVNDSMRSM